MPRIGIIAEGRSDWDMIEGITNSLFPDLDFVEICPDYDNPERKPNKPFGWRGVKAWCEENGQLLDILMKGVKGKELDILIIHIDASMADKVINPLPACPRARQTTDPLRDIIITQWLNYAILPDYVVLVTPSKMTDTWIVATLNPNTINIECDLTVENVLVGRGLLRKKGGKVKKPSHRYLPLVKRVVQNITQVRIDCTEADRFINEFQTAYANVL